MNGGIQATMFSGPCQPRPRVTATVRIWLTSRTANQMAPRPTSVQNGQRSRWKARANVLATCADMGNPQSRKPVMPRIVHVLRRSPLSPNRPCTWTALSPLRSIHLIMKSAKLRFSLKSLAQL